MSKQPDSPTFETPDLNLAAFALASGVELLNVEHRSKQCVFVFDDKNGLASKAEISFLRGDSISARGLLDAQRNLKSLIYRQNSPENLDAFHKSTH